MASIAVILFLGEILSIPYNRIRPSLSKLTTEFNPFAVTGITS